MRIARLIVVDLGVLLALWLGALLLISLGQDAVRLAKSFVPKEPDARAELLPYEDHALARAVWADVGAAEETYIPFVEWRHRSYAGRTLTIGPDGRRRHGGSENGTAIGFFGGSAMWGMGVADGDTIPAIFDRLTQGYAVASYAEVGWTSRQSLEQLVNLIDDGKAPEIGVLYEGNNDVIVLCDLALSPTINGTDQEQRMRARLAQRKGRGAFYDNLVQPFVRLFSRSDTKLPHRYVCAQDPQRADQVADAIVRHWSIAHDLAAAAGGRVVAFLQPNVFVGHPRLDYLPPSVNWKLAAQEALRAEFAAVYPRIRRKMAGVPWFVDLSDAFDGDAPLYVDSVHVAPQGNALIAKRVMAALGIAAP